MTEQTSAQTHYQVRFGRGAPALRDLAPHADLVIWVDALPSLTPSGALVAPALPPELAAAPASTATPTTAPAPARALLADLPSRSAAAEWMLAHQVAAGTRVSVAVIAADDSAEDTLAAGAVIDALAALGIDFSSPEAAVACASFTALERAVGHLFTASVTGRDLVAAGHAAAVEHASGIDSQPAAVS